MKRGRSIASPSFFVWTSAAGDLDPHDDGMPPREQHPPGTISTNEAQKINCTYKGLRGSKISACRFPTEIEHTATLSSLSAQTASLDDMIS